MAATSEFLQGEFTRTLDERFRLSIPQELADPLAARGAECILVKERAGCLSLWPAAAWQQRMKAAVELVRAKMRAGKLDGRLAEVQSLGRLLSTRHKEVQLAGRGRLLIPEGFREFLQVPSRRRSDDCRRRGVRGNLESCRVARVFGKPIAHLSEFVRSIGELKT